MDFKSLNYVDVVIDDVSYELLKNDDTLYELKKLTKVELSDSVVLESYTKLVGLESRRGFLF